jgi:NADPH:quinone reductase-like Zn-dependent oxidoreductase
VRAFVQEGSGGPAALRLREVGVPPFADDAVLVRVHAASVNALDGYLLHLPPLARRVLGRRGPAAPVPGVDLAGVAEAVGARVTRIRAGDAVFGCAPGAFAEYAATSADRLARVPECLSFAQAATLGVAGTTALQGLRDRARLRAGQRVLVYGAGGGVGTFAVQVARALGGHVTAVTGPRTLALVRALGPDTVLDYTAADFAAHLAARAAGFDVILDIAGLEPLRRLGALLAPGGVCVGIGAAKAGVWRVATRVLGARLRTRLGPHRIEYFTARITPQDLDTLAGMAAAGDVTPVIDRTYPFDAVPEAVRYVASRQARAKVVVQVR